MSVWQAIAKAFAPKRIQTRADLETFLETRASYLVQKSIAEYSQARAGMMFSTLLGERQFQEALERAKWLGYPASFAMTAEMTEGYLRPHADPKALERILVESATIIFARFPVPTGEQLGFWQVAVERLSADLARAQLAGPKPVHNIPLGRAREIFAVLPVHDSIKAHDFEMFRNTLRLHLTEIAGEFEERADVQRLAAAMAP